MQVLDPKIYRQLRQRAKPLGITVQELLRVKVIPEFLYGAIELNPQLVKKLIKANNASRVSRWDKWKYPRRTVKK